MYTCVRACFKVKDLKFDIILLNYYQNYCSLADTVQVTIHIQAQKVPKKGKEYLYVSELKIKLDIKSYDAKYDVDESKLNQLNQIIGGFVGSNQKEFIERLSPALEEALLKYVLKSFKNFLTIYTFDDILPDRA